MHPPVHQFTEDGFDLQFGTNVLGHAHLTLCLIPELLAGAKSSPDGKARVVNTSSVVAYMNPKPLLKLDAVRDGPVRNTLARTDLYAHSKYANIAFSNELARRYGDQGIHSNAVNPGNLNSELQRHCSRLEQILIDLIFSYPVERGCLTQLYAATSPEASDINGGWFIPWARLGVQDADTRNPEAETQLWDWIEEQCKGR